ncbi:MAG: hypothetical protein ACRC33_20995 [Gemmataceae bacterium]
MGTQTAEREQERARPQPAGCPVCGAAMDPRRGAWRCPRCGLELCVGCEPQPPEDDG